MGVRAAFQRLLEDCLPSNWRLVPEQALANGARPDGTVFDENHVRRGYWEAKDTRDDLETEIHRKLDRGYPRENTIFEDGRRAVLYQDDRRVADYDLAQRTQLGDLLQRFLGHEAPESAAFNDAGAHFRPELPDKSEIVVPRVRRHLHRKMNGGGGLPLGGRAGAARGGTGNGKFSEIPSPHIPSSRKKHHMPGPDTDATAEWNSAPPSLYH
jgi:hypothetical protein